MRCHSGLGVVVGMCVCVVGGGVLCGTGAGPA